MKGIKVFYSLIALLTCVVLLSCNSSTMTAQTTVKQPNPIDLGLSVLWADRNIGADSITDYGYYFAWGETNPKQTYSLENCKYCQDAVRSKN
ncbi:MAG: hypothetical protein J6U21_15220 [Bacteroidales bacterium]|nr:hypothetical protein [Bacteroidales bacterium]